MWETVEKVNNNLDDMNKLLVIGNGFDLYLGRKTAYKDYFESEYYKDTKRRVFDWIDIIQRNTFGNHNMLDYDFTCWDLLFCMVSRYESDSSLTNWCDVEKVIHDSFVDTVAGSFSWPSVFGLLQSYYYSRRKLISSGFNVQSADFTDEKNISLEIMKWFLVNKGWKDYCRTRSMFFDKLLEELNRFEHNFGGYIKQETENGGYSDLAWIRARDLLKCGEHDICRIESFNYSDFSDMNVDIHHVNGDFDNPIFGIDLSEEDEQRYPAARIFTKTFRRVQQDSHNMNHNSEWVMSKLDHAVVFGHSLNRMDYDYFNYLFTMLRFNTFDTAQMGSITFVYNIYDTNKSDEIRTGYADAIYSLLNYYEGYVSKNNQHILINLLRFSGKLKIVDVSTFGRN